MLICLVIGLWIPFGLLYFLEIWSEHYDGEKRITNKYKYALLVVIGGPAVWFGYICYGLAKICESRPVVNQITRFSDWLRK